MAAKKADWSGRWCAADGGICRMDGDAVLALAASLWVNGNALCRK
ncbi:hypothetical protein [Leclercia sp. M50]